MVHFEGGVRACCIINHLTKLVLAIVILTIWPIVSLHFSASIIVGHFILRGFSVIFFGLQCNIQCTNTVENVKIVYLGA